MDKSRSGTPVYNFGLPQQGGARKGVSFFDFFVRVCLRLLPFVHVCLRFLVNLFFVKLARLSGFSSLFLVSAVFSAHFAREC